MSQPARVSHAERTDKSDRLMVEAAVKLVVERGTEKTTLKDVGEEAGYSRGLAGYRFGSKTGLFEFIVRKIGENWLADLKAATTGKRGIEAIEAAIVAHGRICAEANDALRAFYILWFESIGLDSSLQRVVASIHDRRRRDVVAWIEAADEMPSLPAGLIAEHFNAAVLGIAYQWLLVPGDGDRVLEMHNELAVAMRQLITSSQNNDSSGA